MARAKIRSAAHSRAARKNGTKGGRPRDRLPPEVVKRLGPPPETAAGLRTWNSRLLAEVQLLSIQGLISNELAANIRANAGAIDRALPVDRPPRGNEQDDDQEDDVGPSLQDDDDGVTGIRVG